MASSQPLAFAELLIGGVLLTAAVSGHSIREVLSGSATDILPFAAGSAAGGGAAGGSAGTDPTNLTAVPGRGGLQLPAHQTTTHQTDGLPGYPAHDWMAAPGTIVQSPVNGTVVKLSGSDPSRGAYQGQGGPFGWSEYIKGDNGLFYYLTHFGTKLVQLGQKVVKGQAIGTVGDYPGSTADHIHEGIGTSLPS